MPRRGKAPASAPAPAASGKKRARERGADDDGADDDNDDHPQEGPPTTTSFAQKSKKEALRMEHLSLMVELRNEGLEYLRRQGLERKKTEAKGGGNGDGTWGCSMCFPSKHSFIIYQS